jgi:hypothetical protein
MSRVQSDANLQDLDQQNVDLQRGMMFVFQNEEDARNTLPELITKHFGTSNDTKYSNVLNVCIQKQSEIVDQVEIPKIRDFIHSVAPLLERVSIHHSKPYKFTHFVISLEFSSYRFISLHVRLFLFVIDSNDL